MDVPQISRIIAHDCTDVNGSRLTALSYVDKKYIPCLLSAFIHFVIWADEIIVGSKSDK